MTGASPITGSGSWTLSLPNTLAVDTNNPEALNNLAWILATARAPELRAGAEAERLANQAIKLSNRREPLCNVTLADVAREGFPEMTRFQFMALFGAINPKSHSTTIVSRVEFKYVNQTKE